MWTKSEEELKQHQYSFDLILDSVAASHDLNVYTELLKQDGTLVLLGAPDRPHPPINVLNLVFKRRSIAGSLIGGIKETQEMLDFCAKHKIVADSEIIGAADIDTAYDRMVKSDVKYRFVIDVANTM